MKKQIHIDQDLHTTKNKGIQSMWRFGITSLLPALLALFLVVVLVFLFAVIISLIFKLDVNATEQNYPILLSLMISVFEGSVALVSVWLLMRQLKSQTETEIKENAIKVAEFVFNYNQEFVDSQKFTQIESYFDYKTNKRRPHNILSLQQTPEIRQELIDYLVYLECFASCISDGVMKLESVDNLFAYRFFIAINDSEVQYISLYRYYPFYEGIFMLYREWVWYRIRNSDVWNSSNVNVNNKSPVSELCITIWKSRTDAVPYSKNALDFALNSDLECQKKYKGIYKKSFEEIVKTIKEPEQTSGNLIKAFSFKSGKELGVLEVHDDKNVISIAINRKLCSNQYECFETLIFLLKKYVIKEKPTQDQIDKLFLSEKFSCCHSRKMEVLCDRKESTRKETTEMVKDIVKAILDKADSDKPIIEKEIFSSEPIIYKRLTVSDELTQLQREEIAGLIYDTDPYIYPAMFESKEDAITVLSELIGLDPLYRNDRFYVAQKGEHIIGILLWVNGSEHWSPDILTKVADKKGIRLPKTFSLAVDGYFMDRYENENNKGIISIVNLCVNNDDRKRHVGDELLKTFIEAHKSQDMKLCVIRDNRAAVNLYTRNGFVADTIYDGFSVEPPRPKCIEMFRPSNS